MSEIRKAGDTLILSGALNEATPLLDAQWVGALGKINIKDTAAGTLVRDHAAVTLTTNVTPKRYAYTGAALPVGSYAYEIEVTFTDATVLTWPNDGSTSKLKVVDQLG